MKIKKTVNAKKKKLATTEKSTDVADGRTLLPVYLYRHFIHIFLGVDKLAG